NDVRTDTNADGHIGAGDKVTYHYVVKNTGNVTLNGVTLVDDNGTPGDTSDDKTITLGTASLAPGDTTTGLLTVTLTQPEVDNGSIAKTSRRASTEPPSGGVTANGTDTGTITPTATMTVLKTNDMLS